MIKKQQKWIAILVVCAFMWLMQVSTMPVRAADTAEKASLAGTEQGPDYFEAIAHKAAPANKKSILPWILIGAGIVAVTAAVLFLVVLKKDYDIRGTWRFDYLETDGTVWFTSNVTFAGTKDSGTVTNPYNLSSAYTVVDKTVTITKNGSWALHTATFTDEDTLSGTWDWGSGDNGCFNGTRLSSAASIRQPARNGGHIPPIAGK